MFHVKHSFTARSRAALSEAPSQSRGLVGFPKARCETNPQASLRSISETIAREAENGGGASSPLQFEPPSRDGPLRLPSIQIEGRSDLREDRRSAALNGPRSDPEAAGSPEVRNPSPASFTASAAPSLPLLRPIATERHPRKRRLRIARSPRRRTAAAPNGKRQQTRAARGRHPLACTPHTVRDPHAARSPHAARRRNRASSASRALRNPYADSVPHAACHSRSPHHTGRMPPRTHPRPPRS